MVPQLTGHVKGAAAGVSNMRPTCGVAARSVWRDIGETLQQFRGVPRARLGVRQALRRVLGARAGRMVRFWRAFVAVKRFRCLCPLRPLVSGVGRASRGVFGGARTVAALLNRVC
jgi:hypothetical protein